jgi:hypothetical protein
VSKRIVPYVDQLMNELDAIETDYLAILEDSEIIDVPAQWRWSRVCRVRPVGLAAQQ